MKQLTSVEQLDFTRINKILSTARNIIKSPPIKYQKLCQGKILSIIFFNESLRTSTILKAAMYRLGGHVIEVPKDASESEMDIYNSILPLSDISAIRSDDIDFDCINSLHSVPLINSLCNRDEHALSALWHLLTIDMLLGRVNNLNIGIYGQILHCRPYLSLQKLLSLLNNNFYIYPVIDTLGNPAHLNDYIRANGSTVEKTEYSQFAKKLDVLLISDGCPISTEEKYFPVFEQYTHQFDVFNYEHLKLLPNHAILNYMMPRFLNDGRSTVSDDLLNSPRFYNSQMIKYGIFITMALIIDILEVDHGV
ncbi:hypothetical protein [Brenneria goodwinii]|uniref:hypothetical protein n=1 Tax=Brenneria goodwinii TaxID=1109412 RepID=UPI0036EB8666